MVVMCDWTKEPQLNKERDPYWSHTGPEIMLGRNLKYSLLLCLTEEMRSCKLSLRILKHEIRANYSNTLDKFSRLICSSMLSSG